MKVRTMNAIPKKKLCWNCEGNVARTATDNCPFCGVYLHATEEPEEDAWNPPYRLTTLNTKQDEEVPTPPYTSQQEEAPEANVGAQEKTISLPQDTVDIKKEILPLLCFLSASIFFVFGLILLLFSHQGVLTLQWNGSLWPLFLFGSGPLFFFGYKFFTDSAKT